MLKSPGSVIIQVIFLFLLSFQAHSDLTQDIRNDLKNELYSFSDLLPGFKHPVQNATSLAVANLRADSEDDKQLGRAISEILRFRIQFIPGMPLYMPAYSNTSIDAGLLDETLPLVNVESFKNLQTSLGIETVLTGKILIHGNIVVLDIELLQAGSGDLIKHKIWKAPRNALQKPIIEISKWVYDTLKVKLTPNQLTYLEQRESLSSLAIEQFLTSFPKLTGDNRPSRHKLSKRLLEKHPKFALFAHHALTSRIYANTQEAAYKNLEFYEKLETDFPKNPGIGLESYRAIEIDMLPKHKVSRRLDRMKQLVITNPGDPTIMLNYADKLIENGNALDGVSILLEAIDMWPVQYRLWWSLGWALNSHAWEVRGDKFWRKVPERQKKLFLSYSGLANRAIDRAIAFNPRNGNLLNMKINALGSLNGYSDELLRVFDQAVEVSPNYPNIYHSAMNYAQGKWGGTALARKHIISAAEEHNPGASWVEEMKRVHAAELEDFQDRLTANPYAQYALELLDHPYSSWVLLIVGILFVWAVYSLGRKSAFDEVDDYLEVDPPQNDSPVENRAPKQTHRNHYYDP